MKSRPSQIPTMKATLIYSLLSALLIRGIGGSSSHDGDPKPLAPRSTDTCADPDLTELYKQAFSPSRKAHSVNRLTAYVNANALADDWQVQNDAFLAWPAPQEFTFPMYLLGNPASNDFINIVSTDGSVPIAAGFEALDIIAYVYDTQVCGSVPLFEIFQSVAGTHWHTTSTAERDELLALGWIDASIVAFVLPLTS